MKKRIQHIIYFVFALLAVACSDSFEQDVDVQSGFREVAIQLNLESIEQETVATRAGEAETYHLLVFDKNDRLTNYTKNTSLTKMEKIKVQVARDATDSKVVVAKCTEPPATLPIGSEYKHVIKNFSFDITTQGLNEKNIPLWGESRRVDLIPETPESLKEVDVELVHAAALIQVQLAEKFEDNSETGLGFKIENIYLVNYNKDGYVAYAYDKDNKESIHPNEESKQKMKVKSLTSTTTSDGTNSSHQIWVPEMINKGDEFHPFLLIKATVNCPLTDGKKTTYYKVDFLDKSNNSLDIKRNTKYILTLNRVTGVGFHIETVPAEGVDFSKEDWEELKRNANNTLEYSTTQWDISFTDIWFDQKYYFGVSTASLIFSNLTGGHERTFEIQTNVPKDQISVTLEKENTHYKLKSIDNKDGKTDIYVVTITYDSTKGSDVYENSCIISVPNTCFVYKVKLLHQSHLLNLVEAEVHLKGTYVAEKPLSSVEPKHEIVLDLTFSQKMKMNIKASTPEVNGISFTGNGEVIDGKAFFTLQGEGIPEKTGIFDIPIQIEGLSDISFISRLMVRMEVFKEREIPPIKVCFVTNAKRGDWYDTEQIPKMLQQQSNYGPNGEFAKTKKVTVDGYLQIPEDSKEHYHILFYKSSPTPLEGAALEQEVKPFLKKGGVVIHCSSGIGGVDIKDQYPNYFFYDLAVDKSNNKNNFMTPVIKEKVTGINLPYISFSSEGAQVSDEVFNLNNKNLYAGKDKGSATFYDGYMSNHFTSTYETYLFSLNLNSTGIKNVVRKEVHLNYKNHPGICTINTDNEAIDKDLKEGLKGYVWIANPLIMGGFGLDYFHIDENGKPDLGGPNNIYKGRANSTFAAKLLGWAIRHVAKNHEDINGANRVKKAIYKGYLFDYTDTEAGTK